MSSTATATATASREPVVGTPIPDIAGIVEGARAHFASGAVRPLKRRVALLRQLRGALADRQADFAAAMAEDLGRHPVEAYGPDIAFVLSEIDHTLVHLANWSAERRTRSALAVQPASSKIIREPLGVVCVIAPWNYPGTLLLSPVIAALAAGNTVVAKPSEVAPRCAQVVGEILTALDTPAVQLVQGGVEETTELLAQRFDHIFYTGNGHVGRIVMRAAAENLTPITLELGGKSPAIVTARAKLDVAARRIAWGKFLNAGQTCVAPDYVLVEASVAQELTDRIVRTITEFYGADPSVSDSYGRIVADRHVERLEGLLGAGTIVCGGTVDRSERYVAPTVITDVSRDDPIMQEEIFGPLLPIIGVDSIDDAIDFVNGDDKPLALYVFTEDSRESDAVLAGTSSGGAMVNGTVLHLTNHNLPFGGVGASGMGAYHSEAGFLTFSHQRAVMTRGTTLDPSLIYPPYSDWKERAVRVAMAAPDPRDLLTSVRNRLPF